jgi:hypothetical protein
MKARPKGQLDRRTLVDKVRRLDIEGSYPRLLVLMVLGASGTSSFLASVGLLRLGVEHMAIRYPLAVLTGYLAFLSCIRLWIAYRRHGRNLDADVPDIPSPKSSSEADLFEGGRSGGGGGGARWGEGGSHPADGVLDVDELWPVALSLVAVFSGVIALGYVVWAAPVLLAEVAVDAAVVGAVYRRLRRQEMRSWLDTAVSHTWMPALVVTFAAALLGWGLQWVAPDAATIGTALRVLQ